MANTLSKTLAVTGLMIALCSAVSAQVRQLDGFGTTAGWKFIRSDGVELNLAVDQGLRGNAIRFDYDFTMGTGYGGIQKSFALDLPENFEFTFYLKALSPANNFEIKFLDSTGNNVWWVNNRNFDFPAEWKKIRIRKRHISFAWGPAEDHSMKRFDRVEFTISSFVGGKGTIWIDSLMFESLPPEATSCPEPAFTATSAATGHEAAMMGDHSPGNCWLSNGTLDQEVTIDFLTRREFGGLRIDWLKWHRALSFEVLLSPDGRNWEKAYEVSSNASDVSFIRLPEAEARYVRIALKEGASKEGFGICNIAIPDVQNTLTLNDFLIYAAKNSPAGYFPRYFSEQASYWTVTGVSGDTREALFSEDGMAEVDKALFSIEPMIRTGDSLYNWSNSDATQTLGYPGGKAAFSFVPSVTRECGGLQFITGVTAAGEANKNSALEIRYAFKNLTLQPKDLEFYLLLRPFQVNPYYQFLNMTGGAGRIRSIREEAGRLVFVDDKVVVSGRSFDGFGASAFDAGNPVGFIRRGSLPEERSVTDPGGLASGILKYSIRLEPGAQDEFYIEVPFYRASSIDQLTNNDRMKQMAEGSVAYWAEKTGHIRFNLPLSGKRIIDTWRSNLAYILINRDNAGIQPGSRSYERSWIRDGSLTSSALLKSGIVKEVKEFIPWYTDHQYPNGKVPCVVDRRGPDPVPENDSHGEMIYLIREYFNFTHDTAFLRSQNYHVLQAVRYIGSLIAERSTDHYKNGNDSVRSLFGLVPESISHEGYSAKPMHSYWDDFFTMKGLKDAAEIERILGEKDQYEQICKIRDTFRENLYTSLNLAMKRRQIDYIPGCAELGDFDATSTTIALTPCNELDNLPKPQVYNTFDRYYRFFTDRRDGKLNWVNYTPYENRLIGSFIMLDQPERAHELINFFLGDQRPQGWNMWAEVVWKDYRTPRYIGDMPHTWVGSDFINAARAMFVYENEQEQTLVLGSALYQDWIDAPGGMSVEHLPTYYGEVSYAVRKDGSRYIFSISGDLRLPANGISIRNFNGARLPNKVTVNGTATTEFSEKEIRVRTSPAEVVISY